MMVSDPPSHDYLIIGHIARDLTPEGAVVGGTVSYAGRTALAFDLSVGAITAVNEDVDLSPLDGIDLIRIPTQQSTTFENIYTDSGRIQRILSKATDLRLDSIPSKQDSPRIVHLGPIAREVDSQFMDHFPNAFLGLTPQGWLRQWKADGSVFLMHWDTIKAILPKADAVILSLEDLKGAEDEESEIAAHCSILVVTRASKGARIYWKKGVVDLPAPKTTEVDSTGAGDIFAAAFFIQMYRTGNVVEAGRLANWIASASVSRKGINGSPNNEEVEKARAKANL